MGPAYYYPTRSSASIGSNQPAAARRMALTRNATLPRGVHLQSSQSSVTCDFSLSGLPGLQVCDCVYYSSVHSRQCGYNKYCDESGYFDKTCTVQFPCPQRSSTILACRTSSFILVARDSSTSVTSLEAPLDRLQPHQHSDDPNWPSTPTHTTSSHPAMIIIITINSQPGPAR